MDLYRDLIEAAEADEPFGVTLSAAVRAIKADGGEYRPAYNGWSNRETWNTSLWINNEQSLLDGATETIREAMADSDYDTRGTDTKDENRRYQARVAGEALKEWYEDTFADTNDGAPNSGPVADAWQYALGMTNWTEIAQNMADDNPDWYKGSRE